MSPDAAWKATERLIAKRLGGKRAGPQGRPSVDVTHPHLSIECKERREMPKWLWDAMAQAKGNAKVGQLSVVILHQLGQRHDRDLVLMELKEFEDWHGNCRKEPTS